MVDEYAVKRQNPAGGVIQRLSMMLAALTWAAPRENSLVMVERTHHASSKASRVKDRDMKGVYQAELNVSIDAEGGIGVGWSPSR